MPQPEDETARVTPPIATPPVGSPEELDAELVAAGELLIHNRKGEPLGRRPMMPPDANGHLWYDGIEYALREGLRAHYDEVAP